MAAKKTVEELGWAGAEKLKRHCHNMINTLGATTPPETFLFRGNAYYALGFPYFALADYNTASAVMNISSTNHQDRCFRALKHFPETQTVTFPYSNSHTHIFVKPLLSADCELAEVDGMGRGIVARRDMPAHSLVLRAQEPWQVYPTEDGRCAFCGEALGERMFACTNPSCHEEYCSRDCRTKALTLYHSEVCANSEFQSIELDLYSQLQGAEREGNLSERNAAAAQLLMLRIVATAMQAKIVPSVLPQVRLLSGRLTFSPTVLSESMLHLYDRLASALHVHTIISYEELIGVLARVTANCFHQDGKVSLHIQRSMFNHSCEANVAQDSGSEQWVCSRPVSAKEQLTINYYPHLKSLPYNERSAELSKRNFDCKCSKCLRKE